LCLERASRCLEIVVSSARNGERDRTKWVAPARYTATGSWSGECAAVWMKSSERPRSEEREECRRRTHLSHGRPSWTRPSQKGKGDKRGAGTHLDPDDNPPSHRRHRTTTSLRKQKAGTPHPHHLVLRTRSNAANTPCSGVKLVLMLNRVQTSRIHSKLDAGRATSGSTILLGQPHPVGA
jgi:hypothetical protein